MVKQGEIYFDPSYTYPAGNTEDKLLIVLNKSYHTKNPIIIVPVKTDKANKYKKGCNHRSYIFRIDANEDFFTENTLVQLDIANFPLDSSVFELKKEKQGLELMTSLKKETLALLMKCLAQLKQDINSDLHQHLF
jgi:hypothetical protein